jgi:hypothetical protein
LSIDLNLADQERVDNDRETDVRRSARRAETLFYDDGWAEAVECCRAAFLSVGGDAPTLRICAWVFSNCGSRGRWPKLIAQQQWLGRTRGWDSSVG